MKSKREIVESKDAQLDTSNDLLKFKGARFFQQDILMFYW